MSACRVAIAGFGTVGRSVARLIGEVAPSELRVVAVCNRRVERKRVDWLDSVRWTDRIDDVLGDDVDVVVELIGGRAPAEDWIRRALAAGKSVVTANKQVIAHAGEELLELARRAGRHLRFEAAVAGGVPILRAIESGLSGDRLSRVSGVLNGTCNYILSRIEQNGAAFDEALREAQALGFAEADPTEDIDGLDARAKLAILAFVALRCRVRPEEIACRSIAGIEPIDFVYARRLGCTIRQIAWAERTGSGAAITSVGPVLVSTDSAYARVRGSENVVLVRGDFGGDTSFCGRGAGGDPTAVAVVSDLLAIARSAAPPAPAPRAQAVALSSDSVSPFYVRFTAADRSDIMAALADVMARHGLGVDVVFHEDEPGGPPGRRRFAMSLGPAPASRVDAAVAEAAALDVHVVPPLVLPVIAS
jgi:homoserine dehydrogenase